MSGNNPRYDSTTAIGKDSKSQTLLTGSKAKFSQIRAGDALISSGDKHIIWVASVSSSKIVIYELSANDGVAKRKEYRPQTTSDGYLNHEGMKYNQVSRPKSLYQ